MVVADGLAVDLCAVDEEPVRLIALEEPSVNGVETDVPTLGTVARR